MPDTIAQNIYFVTAAYAVTWIGVLGYLLWLRAVNRRARAAYEQAISAGAKR